MYGRPSVILLTILSPTVHTAAACSAFTNGIIVFVHHGLMTLQFAVKITGETNRWRHNVVAFVLLNVLNVVTGFTESVSALLGSLCDPLRYI